jgi:transposase
MSFRSNVTCRRSICCGRSTGFQLDGIRRELAPFYSEAGRPSIDPELMIRMLLVGYCFGIRSERRLCEEVHLNLAYRWFCQLGLNGAVPDHSTFSKNRHGRFRESDLLRKVFETTVRRCMAEGLVGGEGFAVDASMIKADANRQRSVPGSEWQAPEAANRACRSIWRFSTMPRSARQHRWCQSSSRPPTRLHAGQEPTAGSPYSPTTPTT